MRALARPPQYADRAVGPNVNYAGGTILACYFLRAAFGSIDLSADDESNPDGLTQYFR
jgi:ABC-type maltose transport system permease subunit